MGISDSLSEIKRSCDLTVPLVELLLSSFCVIYRRGCNDHQLRQVILIIYLVIIFLYWGDLGKVSINL